MHFLELTDSSGRKVCVNMAMVASMESDRDESDPCTIINMGDGGSYYVKETAQKIMALLPAN